MYKKTKRLLFSAFLIFFTNQAQADLSSQCEEVIVDSARRASTALYPLEYLVEDVVVYGQQGFAIVSGMFSDAESDFFYGELIEVDFNTMSNLCEVTGVEVRKIINDGNIEGF